MNPVTIMVATLALAWLGVWSHRRFLSNRKAGRVVLSPSAGTGPRHGRRQRGFIRAERGKKSRGKSSEKDKSKQPGRPHQGPRGPIRKPWGW